VDFNTTEFMSFTKFIILAAHFSAKPYINISAKAHFSLLYTTKLQIECVCEKHLLMPHILQFIALSLQYLAYFIKKIFIIIIIIAIIIMVSGVIQMLICKTHKS